VFSWFVFVFIYREVDVLEESKDDIPTGNCLPVVTIGKPPVDLNLADPTLVDSVSEGKVGVDDLGNFPLRYAKVLEFVSNMFNE
jgi:hypothetical protein